MLLKKNFFVIFFLFGSLKITDILIPCMKYSLNYHQQNFIYAFFKKMTVKYLFENLVSQLTWFNSTLSISNLISTQIFNILP